MKGPGSPDFNPMDAPPSKRGGKPFIELRIASGFNDQVFCYGLKGANTPRAEIEEELNKALSHMLDRILGTRLPVTLQKK